MDAHLARQRLASGPSFRAIARKLGITVANAATQRGAAELQALVGRDHLGVSPEGLALARQRGLVPSELDRPDFLEAADARLAVMSRERTMGLYGAEAIAVATPHYNSAAGFDGKLSRAFLDDGNSAGPPLEVAPEVDGARLRQAAAGADRGGPGRSAVLPEDGTLRPSAFYLHLGDAAERDYARQLTRIGYREGFRVALAGNPRDLEFVRRTFGRYPPFATIAHPGHGNVWLEDAMSFAEGGDVIVPAAVASDAAFEAPRRAHDALGIRPGIVGQQGMVNLSGAADAGVAIGAAGARSIRRARSYVEDGNLIPGTLADGTPYAIIGQDSVRISQAHLNAASNAPPLSERDTLAVIAEDYGLKPENLFAVEQPASFHLDMAMLAVGPKEVVLNDSVAAADLQGRWWVEDYVQEQPPKVAPGASRFERGSYRNAFDAWRRRASDLDAAIENLKAKAAERGQVEALTAADLERQGFQVHRIPGVFGRHWRYDPDQAWKRTPENARHYTGLMNFFNGEQALDDHGRKYFITQGGDARAENAFFGRMVTETSAAYRRIYLLPRTLTDETLELNGGVNCRVKADGRRVSPTS